MIINWNTVKATLVLFTKKLLQRDISTVPLYKEPPSRSYLKTCFGSYFLFSFGENKNTNKQLVFLRELSAITLAQPGIFC